MQQLNIANLTSEVSDDTTNGNQEDRRDGATHGTRIVERHLAVLADGSFRFLVQDPDEPRSWCLDKSKLRDFLWDKEMYRLIGHRMTMPALRIVRMLSEKGKLDEKTMLDMGLLNSKELRKCLAALKRIGFLELQEVPKDPHRQPKNTLFLYFYDPERVRKVLLDKLHKSMSKMYQQRRLERLKIASTLGKLDRWDNGSEAEILPTAEVEVLYKWRQKESWFVTEIHRMDDSISILRDI